MRLLLFFLCFVTALLGTSCTSKDANSNEQKPSISKPLEPNSSTIKQPEAKSPQANFPEVSFPEAKFPQANFPEVSFPEADFPASKFPEIKFPGITFPGLKVQSNDDLTIITLPADILFDFNKDNIRPDAEEALRQIKEVIATTFPKNTMQIRGYTDSIGSDAYNQDLSERRARSVKDWLSEKGSVAAERMQAVGYGETKRVAPNTKPDGSDNPEGRQKNRRVEIVIQR